MTYHELNDFLSLRFSYLNSDIEDQKSIFNGFPPTHVLYANVLNPHVVNLLNNNENSVELKKIFEFYEELAQSEDQEVRNVLQVTLLEIFWANLELYNKAVKLMLPKTKQINDEINVYLRKPVK